MNLLFVCLTLCPPEICEEDALCFSYSPEYCEQQRDFYQELRRHCRVWEGLDTWHHSVHEWAQLQKALDDHIEAWGNLRYAKGADPLWRVYYLWHLRSFIGYDNYYSGVMPLFGEP